MKRPLLLALASAALFGASTPISKVLLGELTPFQLAGFLYLGAALGVLPAILRGGGIRLPARLDSRNRRRLVGAIVAGGIAGPVLLLLGLRLAPAASVSLWLNAEMAATAVLGVLFFRDHLGARGWAGVALALVAAILISLPEGLSGLAAGSLVILACLCWGLDNHLTAKIDGITATQSTFWKGVAAGTTNLTIGLALLPSWPGILPVLGALLLGALAYGVSISFYIASAQQLGATRAQILFSTAPLFGVVLAVTWLHESLGPQHVLSGVLFAAGVALVLQERHAHEHLHEPIEHEHGHRHDDGHHVHDHPGIAPGTWHTHRHRHEVLAHAHPHWPDLHHRHEHEAGGRATPGGAA